MSEFTRHVQDNQGIRPSQHGFMKGRSCLTNLISFYDLVTHLVDKGKAVDVVHLDFSKAFDTVSHSTLLEKLAAHGLDACTLCWLKPWLDGRAQRVVVNRVTPSGGWSRAGFPRAQCWGQLCLISLSMTWRRGSRAPSVTLPMTPNWAGALICSRERRLYRGTCTGCIDGPRPIV